MRQFIGEALNCKRVIYVRYRPQPADAHMSFRRAILDAKIWQIVGNVRPALLQMGRIPINGIHVKDRWNRREDRPLKPGGWFAVGAQSVALPFLNSASATIGSIEAWARSGT